MHTVYKKCYDKHMARIALLIAGISLLLNIVLISQNYARTRVVSVPDGDSVQLADGRRVRLLGIDAPERDRCMAEEARNKLISLAKGKHVRLKDIVTDDYGRVLAIVIVEDFPTWISYLQGKTDPLVNRVMLASGLAKYTFSASEGYKETLKSAYEEAKSRNLGIFSSRCRSKTPVTDCIIKGNVRAGEKTYHLPTCDNYTQTIIDESFGDHWFCSETEAKAAGFTKASGCR